MKILFNKCANLNYSLCLLIGLIFSSQISLAQGQGDELLYPELEVTPRASKRLLIEAQKERNEKSDWFAHTLAIQSSALTTLVSGIYLSNNKPVDSQDPNKEKSAGDAANLGMLTGAVWLGFTTYLHFTYNPYQDGYAEVRKIKSSNKREELTKERLAEEKIVHAGSFGRKLSWFSALTQFPISAYMAAKGSNEAAALGAVSALVALVPLFIDTHWETIHKTHIEYKKKIYGPVAFGGLVPTPHQKDWVPGINYRLTF